jgi:hypothetical protein
LINAVATAELQQRAGHPLGGGTVSLAKGGWVEGTEHGEGGVLLRQHFDGLTSYLATVGEARGSTYLLRVGDPSPVLLRR